VWPGIVDTRGEIPANHAGVQVPPPLIHGICILAGIGLDALFPLTLPAQALSMGLGAGLVAAALFIAWWAFRRFARSRNPVPPNQPIHALMTDGPDRFTRNALYLALAWLHAGIGLIAGSLWVLATLALALLVVRHYVIAREEAYLARRFGTAYTAYQARGRRWL
jgi:protein-S-isoprenylcysteine O-methyltransferase Ste14